VHTANSWLPMFARQPAPLQITWLAYPGTTGLRGMGYRLTDSYMDPSGEMAAWSAEEPVRLPDCWCCYQNVTESPEINALPARTSEGFTFGALNNFGKVNERVLALWALLLREVKCSRLLLLCPMGSARERVRAFFGERGISAERLDFSRLVPRSEHLRLYHQIDVGLDPFPCNGMTTTCDALWMGVPVLTLPGKMPISRASLSLLSNVGLGELAASSEEDYVRVGVELAADLPRLAELRATLRARMLASPLMDAPRFARNVEAEYRTMWKTWCAGQNKG
jgi:protein O-GlcNAc transferase